MEAISLHGGTSTVQNWLQRTKAQCTQARSKTSTWWKPTQFKSQCKILLSILSPTLTKSWWKTGKPPSWCRASPIIQVLQVYSHWIKCLKSVKALTTSRKWSRFGSRTLNFTVVMRPQSWCKTFTSGSRLETTLCTTLCCREWSTS